MYEIFVYVFNEMNTNKSHGNHVPERHFGTAIFILRLRRAPFSFKSVSTAKVVFDAVMLTYSCVTFLLYHVEF
jgi:hypothetical protein